MEVKFTDCYFIRAGLKEVDELMMKVINERFASDMSEKEMLELADKRLRPLGWTLKEYHKHNRPKE